METDICSIWAYHEIMDSGLLGERQAIVLSIFSEHPDTPLTATQVVSMIHRGDNYKTSELESSTLRNRIAELRHMGFVRNVDKAKCQLSGKTVNRWQYTGRKIPLTKSIQTICCPKCDGRGEVEATVYQ